MVERHRWSDAVALTGNQKCEQIFQVFLQKEEEVLRLVFSQSHDHIFTGEEIKRH